MKKRAACYARAASGLQNERPLDDQIARCKEIAERDGYTIIDTYTDQNKSGADMSNRDGLLALLQNVNEYDAVIVTSTNRLSRDVLDLDLISNRLRFHDVTLVTEEGEAFPFETRITYARYSNSDPLRSVEAQLADCREIAARHGYKLVKEYSDGGANV